MTSSALELDSYLNFTLDIAREAGVYLSNRPSSLEVDTKTSATDVVTHMDKGSEEIIVRRIASVYPQDAVLAEEGSGQEGSSGRVWVIDPLDGTVNYMYGLPFWAVSIALVDQSTDDALVGVVCAPSLGVTYFAARGKGAWKEMHGQTVPLVVSNAATVSHSLIGTGFGYTREARIRQADALQGLLPQVRDIRRMGSCALDLCAVAEGTLDGYFESGVQPWDRAAGALIAREAGAHVSGFTGHREDDKMTIAATPSILTELVGLVTAAYNKE